MDTHQIVIKMYFKGLITASSLSALDWQGEEIDVAITQRKKIGLLGSCCQ